jgi:hypothetical protein
MLSQNRKAQPILRKVALVLAFVCFWMSAIATLHHTDNFDSSATFATTHNSLHGVTAPAQDIPCVAHQWMDAWHTLHGDGLSVAAQPILCVRLAVHPTPLLRPIHVQYASLRAPPVTLS